MCATSGPVSVQSVTRLQSLRRQQFLSQPTLKLIRYRQAKAEQQQRRYVQDRQLVYRQASLHLWTSGNEDTFWAGAFRWAGAGKETRCLKPGSTQGPRRSTQESRSGASA